MPDTSEKSLVLPGEATSPRTARRFVVDTLNGWSLGELRDTVELLTCELVTNVVLHVRGDITLRLRRLPGKLRVEVADQNPATPTRHPDAGAGDDPHTTGRGIALVEELSAAWGVERAADGKTVWFEVGAQVPA